MGNFGKLKFVAAQAERKSVTVVRRNKLTGKIDHQIAAAKAATEGGNYAAKRVKFVQNKETGERTQVEIATRVKQWWFAGSSGKINLAIRYGAKPIELAKGKNANHSGQCECRSVEDAEVARQAGSSAAAINIKDQALCITACGSREAGAKKSGMPC